MNDELVVTITMTPLMGSIDVEENKPVQAVTDQEVCNLHGLVQTERSFSRQFLNRYNEDVPQSSKTEFKQGRIHV